MIYSKKLSEFKEIIHGFTTREDSISLKLRGDLVLTNQVHEDNIEAVGIKDKRAIIIKTDGLTTIDKGIILGIRTADCCPILFYEPVAKIVSAVHAGWRGTFMEISKKMIREIKTLGGQAENLIAVIGPHIGMCCYGINEDRAIIFQKKFGQDLLLISNFEGKPHLDLAYANFKQLIQAGLKKENIEVFLFCTSCQKDLFFSFRRSKLENDDYGEMLSFIGLI